MLALYIVVIVAVVCIGVYFLTKPQKIRPRQHDYELSKRTYNDGSVKYLAAYRDGIGLDGKPAFFYITEKGSRKPALFDTPEDAIACAQDHWDRQVKSEETTDLLMFRKSDEPTII